MHCISSGGNQALGLCRAHPLEMQDLARNAKRASRKGGKLKIPHAKEGSKCTGFPQTVFFFPRQGFFWPKFCLDHGAEARAARPANIHRAGAGTRG